MRRFAPALCVSVVAFSTLLGCNNASKPKEAALPEKPKLGIRPHGDETIQIDTSKLPPEAKAAFDYIDAHIDEHVENLQHWINQPSISNSGEGIPESTEMVKGYFDKFGCQQSRVYDVGTTEYGSQGNPVVFAKCDFGAPKTLVFYWMYDTMPVTQPDLWIAPPFEGRVVTGEQAGVPTAAKVLIGRGATNTKGPQMIMLNALTSLKETMGGKLPFNVIFVAEGDEERMSIGLRQFMKQHSDLFQGAASLYNGGPSEGCVYVELTTSGASWGRGPGPSDIHGIWKRTVDSPAWRHIQMLASLTSKDGNTPQIGGFFENMEQPTPEQLDRLHKMADNMDYAAAAKAVGVMRFTADDTFNMLRMLNFGTSFNLDGIWGGNMYAGGAGAILPNKVTSKHNFRYVPKMMGPDIVKKLRAQLDKNGYKDVQVKLIGDIPWSRGSDPKNEINTAHLQTMAAFGITPGDTINSAFGIPRKSDSMPAGKTGATPPATAQNEGSDGSLVTDRLITGGYWPSYLFTDGLVGEKVGTVSMPMSSTRSLVNGGRAHAANEYLVLEGKGNTAGMATDEKYVVATVLNWVKITSAPTPAAPTK